MGSDPSDMGDGNDIGSPRDVYDVLLGLRKFFFLFYFIFFRYTQFYVPHSDKRRHLADTTTTAVSPPARKWKDRGGRDRGKGTTVRGVRFLFCFLISF